MNYVDIMSASSELEKALGGRKELFNIPYLDFRPEWKIKIIFPFGGAAARFMVKCGDADISVYLDTKSVLGGIDEPYWELFPNPEGDCDRFLMHETDDLIDGIQQAIDGWKGDWPMSKKKRKAKKPGRS